MFCLTLYTRQLLAVRRFHLEEDNGHLYNSCSKLWTRLLHSSKAKQPQCSIRIYMQDHITLEPAYLAVPLGFLLLLPVGGRGGRYI